MAGESESCVRYSADPTLPPGPFDFDRLKQSPETPASNDGSFLYTDKSLEGFVNGDNRPRLPVNPITGLAYPIILPPELIGDEWTRHHHHFPDSYLGGHALRHIYVQKTYARLHNSGPASIHQQFSIPAELPRTPDEILGTITMGISAHIPHEGLDLHSGDPKLRCMSNAEERRLQMPQVWGLTAMQRDPAIIPAIHMRWRSTGRRKLPCDGEVSTVHTYIREQLLSVVEFMDGYDRVSQIFEQTSHPEVGFKMLQAAAHLLVENSVFRGEKLTQKYKRERMDGRLRPDSPVECADLLVNVLGTRGGLGAAYRDLKLQLQGNTVLKARQVSEPSYAEAG